MGNSDIRYRKRMIAFLDILGFERIVDRSRNDPELVGKLASILKRSRQNALSIHKPKLTILKADLSQYVYRTFSDTSVISGPYVSHDDFIVLSWWVMYYQYLLWKEEQIFLRGSIVYGDIYHDEDIIFGPALIDAYHHEYVVELRRYTVITHHPQIFEGGWKSDIAIETLPRLGYTNIQDVDGRVLRV